MASLDLETTATADWNVTFTNATLMPWVAAIWQELPDAGLTPVSWQQARTVPGQTAPFGWDETYAAALATYEDKLPSGIYSVITSRAAKPSSTWDAITINEVDYVAEVDAGGKPGPIATTNRSAGPVNAGLMQSGAAVAYAHELAVDAVATFTLQPQFRLGLVVELQPGQVIDRSLVIVGPLTLTFPPAIQRLLVTAVLQGQSIVLTVVPVPA
jgi:hypothetical protein